MLLDARRFAVQHYSGSGLMCASAQNEIGGQSTLPSSLCAIATPEPPRYQRYLPAELSHPLRGTYIKEIKKFRCSYAFDNSV